MELKTEFKTASFRLPKELLRILKIRAAEEGDFQSNIVQIAIRRYLLETRKYRE